MDIISNIPPDIPKKPEVKIEYNDRSYQSYITAGNIPRSVYGPRDRMQQFLSKIDLKKRPIGAHRSHDRKAEIHRLE